MSYYDQRQPPVGAPPPHGYPPKDAYPPQGQGYPEQGQPAYPTPYAQPPPPPPPQQNNYLQGCLDALCCCFIMEASS